MSNTWLKVSGQSPCPICKKPDWCTVTPDGRFACCMRVESSHVVKNGGWLHPLKDAPARFQYVPRRPPTRPTLDAGMYHRKLRIRRDADDMAWLAENLGVSESALDDLGACWDANSSAWAFPMLAGDGSICGIRLRADNGEKWAVRGSKDGLFYPPKLTPDDGILYVCEGPTDTAAALTLGLPAVGRPSCAGGVDHLRTLCARIGATRLVIIADNDPPHVRPNGSIWYPGRDGAAALVAALRLPYKLVMPPAKDIRAFVNSGGTRLTFDTLCNCSSWKGLT